MRVATFSLILLGCTSASEQYLMEVDLPREDPVLNGYTIRESWKADCRSSATGYPRADVLIYVSPSSDGAFSVGVLGGDPERLFRPIPDRPPGGTPTPTPGTYQEWSLANSKAIVRALPSIIATSLPATHKIESACALLDVDQEMAFSDVSDFHEAIAKTGFRYVGLLVKEAAP